MSLSKNKSLRGHYTKSDNIAERASLNDDKDVNKTPITTTTTTTTTTTVLWVSGFCQQKQSIKALCRDVSFNECLKRASDRLWQIMLGRLFQACGLATGKVWSPSVEQYVASTMRYAKNAEHR